MAVPSDDLKFALATAAIEAGNAAKNAVNLAVSTASSGKLDEAGAVVAMAQQCAATARDLSFALGEIEQRFAPTPAA